ncbi:MAG: hypothetical protein JO306_00075 [Gemmatimonadetes bacterium]|nr:hypothetical protein [Gemmatimonadota bacterium]
MLGKKLHPDHLHVETFELGSIGAAARFLAATDPVTDPNTNEDTCINVCPTDDTCTRLGCTRALLA